MTIKLTPASFLSGVRQSGLLEPHRLDVLIAEMEQSGVDQNCATALATALVRRGAITEWQSEKLLQGRHKGFILGRYKLLSLLGAGEMSAVYLAEHVMLERRCAIKVLPGNKVKDTSYLGRFHREAKAVARLDHINIVRAYDVDQQYDSGTEIHFLVMEFVAGRNIEKVVSERGPLDFVTAAEFIRQAADGLSHAHQAGMVHRDIKPENLLIDKEGVVKILDLGLARFFQAAEEESLTIKHDEKVLGTADYLAPEQAIDSHKVDARADIYSLGCTFYFALTGHPPFTEGTLVQRLFAHQTKTPKPVQIERPDIPEALVTILEKMMAKKAADRFQTAAELARTLTCWLVDHGGQEWRVKHVVQVAEIKGMDGFNDRPPVAVTSTAIAPGVTLAPTVNRGAGTSNVAIRNRENAIPKVEYYAPKTKTVAVEQNTESQLNDDSLMPVGNRMDANDDRAAEPDSGSQRERSNPEVRRKRVKPREATDDTVDSEAQSSNGTATAVATRSRRTTPASVQSLAKSPTRATIPQQPETKPSEFANNSGMLSWLRSNDAAHVQTRRMVAWVTLSAFALTCSSVIVYWIIQGVIVPEKQVTQPRPDAVIDASPNAATA